MGLLYQLSASDTANLWANDAKSTPVSNGSVVAAWTPKAGSITTDALQTNNTLRPLWSSNYASSGYPAVVFDGSNDAMDIAHSSAWNVTTVLEFLVAMRCTTATPGYRGILQKFTSSAWNDGFSLSHSESRFTAGAPGYNTVSTVEKIGENLLFYARIGTSLARGWRSLASDEAFWRTAIFTASTSTPSTNIAVVRLGNGSGGNFPFAGGLFELRVYSGGETESTITAAIREMATSWGISSSSLSTGATRPTHPMFQQVIG